MEANKLMTGDWVLIKRTPSCEYPYKICSINNYSILGEDYADWIEVEAGEEINLENIKPIPLTAEILEKNGFEVHRQFATFTEYWLDIPRKFVRVAPNSYIEIYNGENKNVRIDGKSYVHELQHALRLCGIDKEIVL